MCVESGKLFPSFGGLEVTIIFSFQMGLQNHKKTPT